MVIKLLRKAYQTKTGSIKHLENQRGNRVYTDYRTTVAINGLLRPRYPKSGDCGHILGWTKLHCATATVRFVKEDSPLRKQNEPKDRDGMTPLHWAVLNNKASWVRVFLKSKCDRNIKDNFGRTPLYLALSKGLLEITNILQEGGGILDGWSRYISDTPDDLEIERLLDGEGTHLNIQDSGKITPLRIHLNIQDSDGMTPLRLAIGAGRKGLVQILLERKADPNAVLKSSGECALYPASAGGDLETVELLLKHGADPSYPTQYLWTPLHWAVGNGHEDVVKALLHAGASPTAASDTGKTPLDMTSNSTMAGIIQSYLSKLGVQEE